MDVSLKGKDFPKHNWLAADIICEGFFYCSFLFLCPGLANRGYRYCIKITIIFSSESWIKMIFSYTRMLDVIIFPTWWYSRRAPAMPYGHQLPSRESRVYALLHEMIMLIFSSFSVCHMCSDITLDLFILPLNCCCALLPHWWSWDTCLVINHTTLPPGACYSWWQIAALHLRSFPI